MNKNDLDKLSVLSENFDQFIDAVLVKLKKTAMANNHDLSGFFVESAWTGFASGKNVSEIWRAHCKKCTYQIELEHFHTNSEDKIYLDLSDVNTKCDS